MFNPTIINSLSLADGQTGVIQFQWQKSTTGDASGFADIPNSIDIT